MLWKNKTVLLKAIPADKVIRDSDFVSVEVQDDKKTKGKGNNLGSSSDTEDEQMMEDIEDRTESIGELVETLVVQNLVMEKVLDIILIIVLALVTINWTGLYAMIKTHYWESMLSIPLLTLVMFLFRCIPCMVRWPGCIIQKPVYLVHRAAVLMQFVHLDRELDWFVCPLLTVNEAITLALYMSKSGNQKAAERSRSFWLYRLAMPIIVLVFSQPLYVWCASGGDDLDYGMYMKNIAIDVGIALLISYEPVLLFQIFIDTVPKKYVSKDGVVSEKGAALYRQYDMNYRRWQIANQL